MPEGVGELKGLCGGEAMPRELAGRLLARSPEFWNLYLLAARLRPVPLGVAGELCMARIEHELGRELPLTALFQSATIEQLATLLRRGGEPTVASCLVALQPGGSRLPLFCVHPAGGNVLCYVPLAQALGPEQPFYAFQSRGLTGDGEPHERVEEMAAHYLAELRQVQPGGPYQLAGWSFGGLVAYEMARQLRAEGEEVGLLALLDTGVPSGEGPEPALFDDDAFWLADVAVFVARLAGQEPPFGYDQLRELAPEEQGELFVARLREADLLPPETGLDQVRRLLRVYKANTRASLAYAPRPCPGPITLLRAAEQRPDATPGSDPTLGWGRLASEPVTVHTVPGDHLTLLARDNVQALAERLGSCL